MTVEAGISAPSSIITSGERKKTFSKLLPEKAPASICAIALGIFMLGIGAYESARAPMVVTLPSVGITPFLQIAISLLFIFIYCFLNLFYNNTTYI